MPIRSQRLDRPVRICCFKLKPLASATSPQPEIRFDCQAQVTRLTLTKQACLDRVSSGQPHQQPEALCMAPGSAHEQWGHAISIARGDICTRLHAMYCRDSRVGHA